MQKTKRISVVWITAVAAGLGYAAGSHDQLEAFAGVPQAAAAEIERPKFQMRDNSAALRAMLKKPQLRRFLDLYGSNKQGWFANTWLGIPTIQNPLDVWITQEILHEVKPDFIVETGSWKGGSAAVWATILAQINPGARIVSVDITDHVKEAKEIPIVRKMATFLVGSSTAPAIFAEIEKQVKGGKVLVILDSAHTREHVYEELKLYSKLVPVGSYVIVQDTGMAVPSPEKWQWANMAVDDFMAGNDRFVVDRSRERLVLTNNPGGFLKRVK